MTIPICFDHRHNFRVRIDVLMHGFHIVHDRTQIYICTHSAVFIHVISIPFYRNESFL